MTDKKVNQIVKSISENFQTMGGGRPAEGNPIAAALRDRPAIFALGVDVKEVVIHVLKVSKTLTPKKK